MTAIPPWVEEEDIGPVTQAQHRALLQMVKDLQAEVRALGVKKPAAPSGDTLVTGKHAGKTRDWCVGNAPDYVVYLADNGWAIARWGFTEEQVEAARANPKLEILRRIRR